MARQTVCPPPVNTTTSHISWNDAEHAASIAAPAESPHKAGSPADREWLRMFNRARTAPSGISAAGYRIAA